MTLSLSWVSRFKGRHGIKSYRLHGEAASVELETLHHRRQELRILLDGYVACDVFNTDLTGNFHCMMPSRALATTPLSGKKKDKSRISIGLCSNMDGTEKLDLIVINKSLNPRCFKAIDVSKLPVHFHANAKAWMTGGIFATWLKAFNLKMSGRKALLLLDNATSQVNLELSNVHINFLSPKTTSQLQPMDAGIIRTFMLKYKAQFVQWLLEMVAAGTEDKKLDVNSAIRMVVKSWAEVRPEAIRHCWIHTGILSVVMAAVLHRQDEPVRPNNLLILANLIDKLSLSDGMDADDYVECDNNLKE
uniref:HTH CENPB-type domain-containing protein n=1 Tax=Peronospora matthiolae TaxID=2874970 RepID=A0AAV1UXA4_9STRA